MTADVTKKAEEREALDAVHSGRPPADVRDHERPDFVVTLRGEAPSFGVEVVSFFDSEVEARLRRLPGYVGALLDGGDFRHKRDQREVKIEKISITTQDGDVIAKDLPAIMRKVPPLDVCAGKVAATIREKDAKFEEPFHLLRHINLIVVDQTNLLAHLPVPPFYLHYCTPDLRRALLASRFREVFFLTTFKSGRAFVPMKMLVTLARLYFFHTACCSTPHLQFEDVHEFTELFARHLSTVAVGPVGFRREQGESEMLYGDSGFLISKGLGVTVRLYHDGVWPTSAAEVPKTAVLDAGLPPFGLTILSDQLLAEASYEIGAMRGLNRLSA